MPKYNILEQYWLNVNDNIGNVTKCICDGNSILDMTFPQNTSIDSLSVPIQLLCYNTKCEDFEMNIIWCDLFLKWQSFQGQTVHSLYDNVEFIYLKPALDLHTFIAVLIYVLVQC